VLGVALAGAALAAAPRTGRAGEAAAAPRRIGLVLSPGGLAAEQARLGAEVGLREGQTFAEFFGARLELVLETAADPAEAGRKATDLVRKAGVLAVAGGLDDATAGALRDAAGQAGGVVLNIGARGDALRNAGCHSRLFHVFPSDAMFADVLVSWLAKERKVKRVGLVAGESPSGRALADACRTAVARAGAQVAADATVSGAPGLRGALERASRGADTVLLALSSAEQLEAVRQARAMGLAVPVAGPGLGPQEVTSADLVGANGVWSLLWYHETTRFSARELNRRFRDETGKPMGEVAWAAWAAVRLLAEAAVRAESPTPAAVRTFLAGDYPFDGHKGEQLTFRPWDLQLRTTFVLVSPRAQGEFKATPDVHKVLSDNQPRDLDAVGTPEAATRCRLGA
jgi:ABC transporter substrate binding protein (PQQ-dependent alcohol dehydrogenase system)